MFTPPANKKITQICIQCTEGISQNNSERNEDSFESITRKEVEEYINDQKNFYNKQIKNIEDVPDLSLENTNDFDYQEDSEDDVDETPEEHPSTINRLRRYANKLKPEKISKASKLRELKKKYPYFDSQFNRVRDRDERQYSKLVSTIDLKVAEFVLKWEHEHKKRIRKDMTWELLTERKDDGWISVELLEKMNKKYEE